MVATGRSAKAATTTEGERERAGSVSVRDLWHRYPLRDRQRSRVDGRADEDLDVLHGASLEVAAGRSLALLGPSGCGKTTLLRSIAGLERPRSGSVVIDGRTVSGDGQWVPPEQRRVGMVFQDWALFPHLTVARNVAYGLGRADRDRRVEESLAMVGLQGLGDRMPGTLSGGQQQRVALARALAPRPRVLLLDEPFSNLDTDLRSQVRGEVRRLLDDVGITSIFVTHDQEEAFVLGDEVAVMNDGRVVQVDSPHRLYTEPASRWVAEFVGEASLLASTAENGKAVTPFGRIALHIDLHPDLDGPIDVLLRPEQLRLVDGDQGVVELIEYYGHDAMVFVGIDGDVVRVRTGPDPGVVRGDRVGVAYTAQTIRAFPSSDD